MNRPPKRFYEFASFRIDIAERQLLRENKPVTLTPKVFDTLLTLVENNRRTLTKNELVERVWQNVFVEEGNLSRNISTLRKVLGDDFHDPQFIKTVAKRGYRFDSDVREVVEDDETLFLEKRTDYRLTVTEKLEKHADADAQVNLASRRFVVAAVSIAAILLVVLALGLRTVQRSDAHSMSPTETFTSRGTDNADAWELYQKGRALWQNRSVDGLHDATMILEQAVRKDHDFALAHAALADAYAFDVRLWKKAEATANEAIRIDPALGQPHATIGFVRMFWEWRLRDAEPHFRQAVTLSPDYATAHQWYSLNLAAMARGGEALAEMKRAHELEPDSLSINADLCQVLYFSRKYDQAIEQCSKTLDMDPDFFNAHSYLYEIYTAKEMYPEAVAAYFKAEELHMTTLAFPAQIEKLKKAYAVGGIRAFWRQRIEMLKSPVQTGGYAIARYHARLGEREQALRWLIKAHEESDFDLVYLAADPVNTELLTDQRIVEMARKMDL